FLRSYIIEDPDIDLLLSHLSKNFSSTFKRISRFESIRFGVFIHRMPAKDSNVDFIRLTIVVEYNPVRREAILTFESSLHEDREAKLANEILGPANNNQWNYRRNDRTIQDCPYCGATYVYRIELSQQDVTTVVCHNCAKEFQVTSVVH
ncbi:MAG: hypothetical protein ACFFBM_13905, partial [Promethearchaeota archaeon]